ncbi:hypothetical protein [Desulfogranum marinum]|uniref:hypothetical protein n=1 Tax=Desulfogranum marinum TaxID=453220 RepID=UPI0029C6D84A|nr:hypothetical protein [Desulfogranum marinum]
MHLFEYLLRDFINVEKKSHRDSLILIHDILSTNKRMTSRILNSTGDKNKEPKTSKWWTGDVWKILLILKEYRKDIHFFTIDCAPTGLLCCSCLNPFSDILEKNYFDIIKKYASIEFSLDKVSSI